MKKLLLLLFVLLLAGCADDPQIPPPAAKKKNGNDDDKPVVVADNSVGFPPPRGGTQNGKPLTVAHELISLDITGHGKPSYPIHIDKYKVTKFQADEDFIQLDDGRKWKITYFKGLVPLVTLEKNGDDLIVTPTKLLQQTTGKGYFKLEDFFTKVIVRQEDDNAQHTTENTFREVNGKPVPFKTCVHYVLKGSPEQDRCP